MKKLKKLFKSYTSTNLIDSVVKETNHNMNADEMAAYIRKLERENIALKNMSSERSTIYYRLGEAIVKKINRNSSNKEIFLDFLNIYIESRKRKYLYLEKAPFLDKLIILLADEDLKENYLLIKLPSVEKDNTKNISYDSKEVKNLNTNEYNTYNEEKINNDYSQKNRNVTEKKLGLLLDEEVIELSVKNPVWYKLKVRAGQKLVIRAASQYLNMKNTVDRKAVLMINSYDDNGKEVDTPCGQMVKSENLHVYFKYIPSTNNDVKELHSFVVPSGINYIQLGLSAFNTVEEQKVLVSNLSVKLGSIVDQNDGTNEPGTIKEELQSPVVIPIANKFSNDKKSDNEQYFQENSTIERAQLGTLIHKDGIELSEKHPVWFEIPVEAKQNLAIKANSEYLNMSGIIKGKALLVIKSYSYDGKEIDIPCGKMSKSQHLNMYFKYINSTNNHIKELHNFVVPDGVSFIRLGLYAFRTIDGQRVFVKSLSIDPKISIPSIGDLDSQLANVKAIYRSEILANGTPFIDKLSVTGNERHEIANFKVSDSVDTLEISALSLYRLKNNVTSRKAVVLLEFLDIQNNVIKDVSGIGFSTVFNQFFRYLNNNCDTIEQDLQCIVKFKIPDSTSSINVTIASISLKKDEKIDIRFQILGYSEAEEKKAILQNLKSKPLPSPIIFDPYNKRYTSDLTIASILDEFTTECLFHEVDLIQVTQEDWQSQLEKTTPDFLLVESCWRGNNGNWGTLTKGSGGGKKLSPLLQYCKKNNIPTVFWNKEDPPHYEKFGAIARLFDVAITTDINMVDRYKKDFGIDVYPLSFAAQPKIHNPAPIIPRLNKAVFAGSYYRDKYKRCADFDDIMVQVKRANVDYDIFDRNYHKNIENFIYPDQYQDHIIGNLPAEDVWKAHKGYKYQVNMNTVQDSGTMFARRVYESLASGTPVISNDSVGVQQLFGDLVIMPNKKQSITKQLKDLESSHLIYEDRVRRGVRRVMREHTYSHRIQQICKLLGIDVEVAVPNATLAITVNNESEITRAKSIFDMQTASSKQLFIELENFDNAHQFLNKSNSTISYAMKLGRAFYDYDNQYYGTEKVLKCNINDSLTAEALEDFIYWGKL
tara:strand:- start:1866 stop:5174 length:3309 start_codon:yes stop_codon:yes gene_type:complete